MSYSLTKLLDPLEGLGGWIAGDDDVDAGALGVFELGADVGLVVLGEVDGAGGVELDAGGGVVGQGLRLQAAGSMGRWSLMSFTLRSVRLSCLR